MKPVHVSEMSLAVPQPIVAKKATIPCYVVVDGIPDELRTEKGQTKAIDIYELRTFVSRDVAATLANWFETVQPMPAATPEGKYILVRASVTKIGTSTEPIAQPKVVVVNGQAPVGNYGPTGQTTAWMDWSVALQMSGADDLIFSMTDRAPGTGSISYVWETEQLIRPILENALLRFAQQYESSGAHQRVLELQKADATAGTTPSEPQPATEEPAVEGSGDSTPQ